MPHPATIAPRCLKQAEAANYCGFKSIQAFKRCCEVRPVALGSGIRDLRYDIRDLDNWIDRKKGHAAPLTQDDWLGRVGYDDRARERR